MPRAGLLPRSHHRRQRLGVLVRHMRVRRLLLLAALHGLDPRVHLLLQHREVQSVRQRRDPEPLHTTATAVPRRRPPKGEPPKERPTTHGLRRQCRGGDRTCSATECFSPTATATARRRPCTRCGTIHTVSLASRCSAAAACRSCARASTAQADSDTGTPCRRGRTHAELRT